METQDLNLGVSKEISQGIQLEESWRTKLGEEFKKDYMVKLKAFLKSRYDQGATIYPRGSLYFAALNATPFDQVKAVIIGQDPYHGPGQAHGLCFSVQPGVALPPSLRNIYKEMESDLGISTPTHGCLTSWSEQGVLLLNSVLTVEQGKAGAHQNKGWELFTDAIVAALNESEKPLAFILWGSYAQKKAKAVDRSRHLVVESVHPSPLSAHRGFFGTKPFSAVNDFLSEKNRQPIDWSLPTSYT